MFNQTGIIQIDQSVEAPYLMLLQHMLEGKSPSIKCSLTQQSEITSASTNSGTDSVQKIAVIPIEGLLMQNDMYNFWGERISYGTKSIADMIDKASESTDTVAIILQINSGGGFTTAKAVVIEAIQNAQANGKKVYAHVNGMAASLAYGIAVYCDAIYSSGPACMVGCIGTMMSLTDLSKLYERMGVKVMDVYSSLSPDKNSETRQAIAGNIKPLQQNWLDPSAQDFIDSVKAQRPNVSAKILKGATVSAKQAIEHGLIDDIMSLKTIVSNFFGGKPLEKTPSTTQTHDEEMSLSLVKLGVLASTLNIAIKSAEGSDLSADEILDAISTKLSETNTQASTLQTQVDTLTAEKQSLTEQVTAKDTQIGTLQTQVTDLQAKVGASVGAARSEARQEGNDVPPATPNATTEASAKMEGEDAFKRAQGL